MKKQHLILEFIIISAWFVFPPIFISPIPASGGWHVSVGILSELAAALYLYKQYGRAVRNSTAQKIISAGAASLAFGQLCTVAAVIQLLSNVLHIQGPAQPLPDGITEYALCSAAFAISAFFEEMVYRLYLPSLSAHVPDRLRFFAAEVCPIMLFALAHRYLGLPAVINAAAGGFFLRRCIKKCGSAVPGACAHFLYNIFTLILLKV